MFNIPYTTLNQVQIICSRSFNQGSGTRIWCCNAFNANEGLPEEYTNARISNTTVSTYLVVSILQLHLILLHSGEELHTPVNTPVSQICRT